MIEEYTLLDDDGAVLHYQGYREVIDDAQDFIISKMGVSDALTAICKHLDYDTKAQLFDHVIRSYELYRE